MLTLGELHGATYKRAIFYFPTGDEAAIEEFVVAPDYKSPGSVRDLSFKFCGTKLKKSAEFSKLVEEVVPSKFHDRFQKSEKGIDIEMCCDALRLASTGRMDRMFLLSNDADFVPLCRTLKEFGANISIIHLSEFSSPNLDLLREADSFDIVATNALETMFQEIPVEQSAEAAAADEGAAAETASAPAEGDEPQSEKPDTEPSDLDAKHDGAADGGKGEA